MLRHVLPMLIILSLAPVHGAGAPAFVNIKATFYDHEIGAFDGEFGARKPGVCGYNHLTYHGFDTTRHMVQDTLSYSREIGKKIPRMGTDNCNSDSVEKWFDPAHATGIACLELPFTQVQDTAGKSSLKFSRDLFFPIDSIAPPGQLEGRGDWGALSDLTYPPTFIGKHNFNWCMEINAQFKYRGGEVFSFRGDDDVWVYLDDKLVVDQGGIHGGDWTTKVVLDSLPYLKDQLGDDIAFDMYQCERRPAGSTIDVLTNLDLRPTIFRDLEITDSGGEAVNPKHPMVGVTRLCAQPQFAKADPCGNALPPQDTTRFYPATWALNDKVFARNQACIDLDPDKIPPNQRVSLSAKAQGRTARLNVQVLRANVPSGLVLKGNGRLESMSIALDSIPDSLYAPMHFDFQFAGMRANYVAGHDDYVPHTRWVSKHLEQDGRGPYGFSGLDSDSVSISQTVLGFPLSFKVPLKDSISPGIRSASWKPGKDGGIHLVLSPSERLAPGFSGLPDLVFKGSKSSHYQLNLTDANLIMSPGEPIQVAFPPGSTLDPREIDSVSFLGTVKDTAGNQAQPFFTAVPHVDWSSGIAEIISVGLHENPVTAGASDPSLPPGSLVLLNKNGDPISSGADAQKWAGVKGPILEIRTMDQPERLELWTYTNLGAFVDHGTYSFTPAEWEVMRGEAVNDTALIRILWCPSADGAKLGTGAYLLKGTVSTLKSWSQSDGGAWKERIPSRKIFGPMVFGFLRR